MAEEVEQYTDKQLLYFTQLQFYCLDSRAEITGEYNSFSIYKNFMDCRIDPKQAIKCIHIL